jgi:hypothetical protein
LLDTQPPKLASIKQTPVNITTQSPMDPALPLKEVNLDLSTLPEDPEGMMNIFSHVLQL